MAVAGRPNVGKSTLVNALCGGKVAIVSDKPQTTRRRIFGIANGDDYQLVLADLPGFQRPRDALTEHMQRTVDSSFEDVDASCSYSRRASGSVQGTASSRAASSSWVFPS
jgi:GTP-binding protein Era